MFGLNSTTVLILNKTAEIFKICENFSLKRYPKQLTKTAYQNIDKMKKTRPTSKNFRTIPKELQLINIVRFAKANKLHVGKPRKINASLHKLLIMVHGILCS